MACLEGKEVMDRITDMKCESILMCAICVLLTALSVHAENAYTNHAGNAVAGWPVKLTQKEVVLAEGGSPGRLGGTPRPTTNCQLTTTNHQLPTTNYQLLIRFPSSPNRSGVASRRTLASRACRLP